MEQNEKSNRRKFFELLTKGVAMMGLTSLPAVYAIPVKQGYQNEQTDLETWFDQLKGKHKIVFDAVTPNDGFQIVWSHTFLTTNNQVGFSDKELGVMVVLRGKAVLLALEDRLWKKYKLGKFYKLIDMATNAASERNLYWNPQPGEMPKEGMSIKALQERGVLFCVCEAAITVNSRQVALSNGLEPAEVKKEWYSGLLPGIQPVPSGVLALNRVQERGASYCYAG